MMTADDIELRIRAETDPRMMAELGGPRPREDIERAHAKSLVMAAESVPDDTRWLGNPIEAWRP